MVQGVAITDEKIVQEIRDMLSRNEHFLGVFMRKEPALDGEPLHGELHSIIHALDRPAT